MSDSIPPREINSTDYHSHAYQQSQTNHDESQLNRLAICQVYDYRCSLEFELHALKQANIQSIGLYRPRFAECCDQDGLALLRQHQIQVSSVAWAGGFTGSHGFTHDEAVTDACDAVKLAAQAGAGTVLIATGARCGHTRNHTTRLICDGLKEVSDFALDRNVELAVIPMLPRSASRWTCLNSIEEAMQVILKCNRPNVGLGIDVSQLQNPDLLLDQAESIAPHTKIMRMQVFRTEVCSEGLEESSEAVLTLPLEEIVSQFTQQGYEGFFEFDLNLVEKWSAKTYRQMLFSCRELFAQTVLI
ncbi:MAG: TIM barrel protein [Planctomycetaceae bacterium]|nr:TIM barrel protein [Planctomycetaceae bacterium]